MTASRLAFHPQDVRTPPTMASDNHLGGASVDLLLAHLESSKQALEHQVQQLLQENRSSKFAKKEQQWQMESKRFQSELENMSVTLKEKEERISRLEKELREARNAIQQVHSRCREAEKEKERGALERASLQADVDDAQASFQNLQREYRSKHDVAEKQRRALESLADKVEKQKEIFQNQLEDARRRLVESEEREHKFEVAAQSASQQIAEKERQLKSLRDAHEKLLSTQRGKQAEEREEVREVIQVLESTQAKCEEQKKLIKELEQELGKIRKEAHRLDARASVAEANASAKAALLEKVQLELKNTSSHVVPMTKAKAHIEELKTQIETLRRSLQDAEDALSEESALRFKAECTIDEYKVREKSLLKIEQDGKALKEEIKWRNEQFESLEEAHNRMRDQLHDGRNMWASEKAELLREIEALTKNLQSRDSVVQDLRSQAKLLQKSLAHEENCRKLVEFQLADAKAGMESVSAEFLSVQSILEMLRVNSKTELSHLKGTLTEKDKHLKKLHEKQKQMDHDQKLRLTELEAELDNYKSNFDRLKELHDKQKQVEHDQKLRLADLEAELDNYKSNCDRLNELHEKQKQMDHDQKLRRAELEAELDKYKSNCEHLKELHDKQKQVEHDEKLRLTELKAELNKSKSNCEHLKELHDKQKQVEHDQKLRLTELEAELDKSKSNCEHLKELHDKQKQVEHDEKLRLADLEAELNKSKSNCEHLKELHDKQKQVDHDQRLRLAELEGVLDNHTSNCVHLKELHMKQNQMDYDQKLRLTELEAELDNYKINCEHLQLALENRAEQEILAMEIKGDDVLNSEERAHLIRSLSDAEITIAAKEVEMNELKMELDRTHTLAELLRTSLAEAEANSLEEKSSLKQAITSLFVKQHEVMELELKLEKLRAVVGECKNDVRECKTDGEAKVTLLEERLSDATRELQEKRSLSDRTLLDVHENEDDVRAVRSECESLRQQLHTCETERCELKKHNENLVAESREKKLMYQKEKEELLAKHEHFGKRCLMKESQLSDLHDQIERQKKMISTLEARCSTSEQELSKQLALVDHAREEVDVWKLNAQAYKERAQALDTSLGAEAAAKDSSLQEIKGTLQELTREAKDSKAIIDNLNKNLQTAEVAAVARSGELHELRKELESKSMQLLSIAEQSRVLEDKLRVTEAIVHDKEQRLAASEWTVEQLASEIAKSKSFLTQKEKNEVVSKDRLSHVETHLKEREREFVELHCDLENAVKTSNERYTAMQQLTCSMEELTHELDSMRRALKEETVALAASEAEVKRVLEVQRLTEEALATCKERLSSEVKTNAARENDMNHLCEEMECAKQEIRLADAQVKDLQERLKCLERTTEARLESYERKMEKGAADLSEYKNNCAGLMELIEKKDVLIHDLESKVEYGRRDLAKQVMVTEQKEQELASVTEQLDTKTKMHSNLEVELATADDIIKQLDLQKRGLEDELRELKTSFSLATEAVKEKASELEQQRRSIERLESLAEAQVAKVKELTSNAVEERDNKISRLQTALDKAHDDLQSAYQLVSAKDGEKHTLSSRLSEMDAVVEKSKSQISQLQASLQLARVNLEAETERVWKQVAARTEIETKRDSWKAKAAVLTAKNAELESFISKLQAEVKEWKEVAEHTENLNQMELEAWKARVTTLTETNATFESSLQKSKVEAEEWKEIAENTQLLNAELEKSLHAVEDSVIGWEKVVTSVAEEGDVTKRHLEYVLKQVHEEFRCLQEDLANSKDLICSEGRILKAEFLNFVTDSHKAEEPKSETLEVETRELVTALQAEVEIWKKKADAATEEGLQMKAQFEELLKSLQGELKTWKQFETLAREERQSIKAENAPTRIEGAEPDVFTPMSINPFHQEDEGCSSGLENDDAAQQLNGWKSKSSAVAKEGRKLTRQFRASFKHLQFELESRKQASPSRMAKHESFVHRHENTGLEELVKALQEEAVEVKTELAGWKSKATFAAASKEDMEKTISKLNAEVEVWKDRSAMSAGQRIVARRQLDDYSKQVKSLNADLQKWKDAATEANECATKLQTSLESLQKEHEEVRAEFNEWMQKALEFNCRIKDLEQDVEESRRKAEELEHEVEKWKTVAATAEEDGKSATMELVDTLGKFEDELEVMSSNSIGDCSSVGGRSLREEDLDCTSTWQRSPSGRFSNEWRPELETSLQAEMEDWKKRVEKEKLEIQQRHETTVKELHIEVEAWKKCAEDRAESEKKLKLDHATDVLSLQEEVERWKASAADAAQECTSVLDLVKELQSELTQWKEKSETATKEANAVKVNLENVIQDLEHQVRMWKQKADNALEGVVKSQEYEDLIKALEEELCLWTQRVKEGKALQLELEQDRAQLKESLTATQTELQKWKDRVAAMLQEEDDDEVVGTDLESELQRWKSKAIGRELLKDMLAVTLNELQEWKQKAAELGLMAEALKEELIIVIDEGRLETEELSRSRSQLDAKPQERQSLRTDTQRCAVRVA